MHLALFALGSICTWLYALGSMHLALCTWLYALGSMHLAPCTWLYVFDSVQVTLCKLVRELRAEEPFAMLSGKRTFLHLRQRALGLLRHEEQRRLQEVAHRGQAALVEHEDPHAQGVHVPGLGICQPERKTRKGDGGGRGGRLSPPQACCLTSILAFGASNQNRLEVEKRSPRETPSQLLCFLWSQLSYGRIGFEGEALSAADGSWERSHVEVRRGEKTKHLFTKP